MMDSWIKFPSENDIKLLSMNPKPQIRSTVPLPFFIAPMRMLTPLGIYIKYEISQYF